VQLKKEKERLEGERARQEELNRRLERELDKLKEARRRDLAREGDELRMEIRQARAELRTIRKNIGTAEAKQHELSVDKVAALVSTSGKVTRALSSEEPPASPLPAEAIRVGDRVQVAGFGTEAEVLELPKKGRVRVLLGVMKMSVALADVVGKRKKSPPTHHNNNQSRTSASEALSSPQAPVRTQESTLDLRGQRVEESLLLVDQFIDHLLRLKETGGYVLHGHGTGALKEAVRVHLRAHTCVGQSRPAERDEGGDAFTVFWLAL
jgi:DNA mismatch repair protein MutS2